jgi:DNA repair photolyase
MPPAPAIPAPQKPLVGIARLAAQGEFLQPGHDVRFYTLPARSLLNRCTAPHMPFTWTINPYRGCEFACRYCYARYTHEFMELRDGVDFERMIYVKQNAAWMLRRDLRRVRPGEQIAIGTATDPYQPAERRFLVTRSILEEFALHRGLEIGMVTKSNMVVRDLDLLRRLSQCHRLSVSITITTLDAALARKLEPRAPRPDLRLDALRKLAEAGIDVGVICAPVLPGINDAPAQLDALARAAAQAGARHFYANPLFLKPCSSAIFLPFLEQEFPSLVEDYRRRFSQQAFVSAAYRKRISELTTRLRAKYGIARSYRLQSQAEERALPAGGEQLALFAFPPAPAHTRKSA